MKKILLLSLLLVAIYGQENFRGVTYFDYTYDLTEDWEYGDGFGLERVYFTYKQVLSEDISYTFQTDIDSKASPFNVYLKNAKIDWKLPGALFGKLTLGLQGMNIFNVTEKTWGFRFLQKSAMDKHGFSSSADMGIGYSGKFNNLNYSFMYTNGSGYKNPEDDKYKKISAQFVYGQKNLSKKDGFNIGTSFAIEPYNYITTTYNKTLMAFYGGYAGSGLRIGGEFDIYTEQLLPEGLDVTKKIMAGYVSYKLSDKLEGLVYVDMYDPDTSNNDDGDTDLIIGANYYPTKGLTITPNLRISTPEGGNPMSVYMMNCEFKF